MERKEYLKKELESIGLQPTELQMQQLLTYYEMVVEKNQVMNLTAITEFEEFVTKHFVDSLMLSKNVQLGDGIKMIDIGTGAGFPGIPLKIMYPQVEMVLLDSLNKRILFLQDVIRELGLKGITAMHARAEEPAHKAEYREQFHYCVSRAVANLTTLTEYCLPYVKVGGQFVPYKSGKIEDELKEAGYAIGVLGGEIGALDSFQLPGTDMERTLIHIEKKRSTPKKFPRTAGKPAKEPLQAGNQNTSSSKNMRKRG